MDKNPLNIDPSKFRSLNEEDSHWMIRWVFLVRKYKQAKAKIKELEDIIKIKHDKREIYRLTNENERLTHVLKVVREQFIPINNTKHRYKKKK
jgi:cell shape-determining protein MreC